MNDLNYCQYAFAQPDCRVQEIGLGVDARFPVELVCDGPIAAVVSRIGLDHFVPDKLQGRTADEVRWLGQIAARHNEIICQAAQSSTVLPLRLGTLFRSRDSLRAALARSGPTVVGFLRRFRQRREWGVKLYWKKSPRESMMQHAGPAAPHYGPAARTGTGYLTQKKSELTERRQLRAGVYETLQTVEQRLSARAEDYRRIRTLPSELTGRSEEMVFNAAFLLPSSAQEPWSEIVERVGQEISGQGLLLELSGPWPPYHFCPSLEL
jgi:hypothetical protein